MLDRNRNYYEKKLNVVPSLPNRDEKSSVELVVPKLENRSIVVPPNRLVRSSEKGAARSGEASRQVEPAGARGAEVQKTGRPLSPPIL